MSPKNKKKLEIIRSKLDKLDNKLLSLITKKERDKEDDFKMGKLATCDENNEIIWIN